MRHLPALAPADAQFNRWRRLANHHRNCSSARDLTLQRRSDSRRRRANIARRSTSSTRVGEIPNVAWGLAARALGRVGLRLVPAEVTRGSGRNIGRQVGSVV